MGQAVMVGRLVTISGLGGGGAGEGVVEQTPRGGDEGGGVIWPFSWSSGGEGGEEGVVSCPSS